jgi:hypothetical protein
VPFTPTGVRANSSTSRSVLFCVLDEGFSLDPKTGKPARARSVLAARADLVKVGGRWKVDRVVQADFSCTGVTV